MERLLKQRFLELFGDCPDQCDLNRFYTELHLLKKTGCLDKLGDIAREFENHVANCSAIDQSSNTASSMLLGLMGLRPVTGTLKRPTRESSGEIVAGTPALPMELRTGEVTLLAGRPATGKTTIACKAAELVAEGYDTVLYFALDDPVENLMQMVTGNRLAHITKHVIFDDTSETMLQRCHDCFVLDPRTGCIEDRIELMCDIHDAVRLVVVDFMQAFKYDHNTMKRLKRIAVDNGCAVLAISAVSRASEGRCPRRQDIDPALLHDVDKIIGTYRVWGNIAGEDDAEPGNIKDEGPHYEAIV